MMSLSQSDRHYSEEVAQNAPRQTVDDEPILCPHCRRTASNGIQCKGICVADSDY